MLWWVPWAATGIEKRKFNMPIMERLYNNLKFGWFVAMFMAIVIITFGLYVHKGIIFIGRVFEND
jgi:hypothetical protein